MPIPPQLRYPARSTIIRANRPISMQFKTILKKATEEKSKLLRDSLEFTEQEVGLSEVVGAERYLVVGLVDPVGVDAETVDTRNKQITGKRQSVGHIVPDAQYIVNANSEFVPLMAVTQVASAERVKYWVLLKPVAGLCTPYPIAQDQVFFLPDFRTNNAQRKTRGPSWGEEVSKVVKGLLEEDERSTIKLVLEPNQSFANEVLSLAEAYGADPQDWHLKSLASVLQSELPDLRFIPPPEYSGLRMLADPEDNMDGEQDTASVVANVQSRWPEVKNVTAARVRQLKNGLLAGRIILKYRNLRGFLASGCHMLAKEGDPVDRDMEIAREAIEITELALGPLETTAVVQTDRRGALIAAITAKLQEMVTAGQTFNDGLKQMTGSTPYAATLPDIWARFGESLTTDDARLCIFYVAHLMATELGARDEGMLGMVKDLAELMSQLNVQK